jgi:transcription elongation factor Elf1
MPHPHGPRTRGQIGNRAASRALTESWHLGERAGARTAAPCVITVAAMAARTVTCGACGASTRIPDRDWDQQRDVVEEWWDEHVRFSHAGEDKTTIVQQVEPNPLFEPSLNPFWG